MNQFIHQSQQTSQDYSDKWEAQPDLMQSIKNLSFPSGESFTYDYSAYPDDYDESGSDTKFIQKIAAIKRIQLHRKKLKAKRASIILMAEKKEKEILAKKGKITTTKSKALIHKSHSSVK